MIHEVDIRVQEEPFPTFSVIIPLYNKEDYIAETINSVLAQTYEDFEVIVVDDGSTDGGPQLVRESFDDSRITLISKSNGGVSSARNTGIQYAKGRYVAFLDGDDLWRIDHLSTLMSLIEKGEKRVGIYCTGYNLLHNDATICGISAENVDCVLISSRDFFRTGGRYPGYGTMHFVSSSSVCINKQILTEIGGFDTRISHGEDTDLWRRVAMRYSLFFCTKQTALYRVGTANNSFVNKNVRQYRDRHLDKYIIYGPHFNLPDMFQSVLRYLKGMLKALLNIRYRQY